MRVGSLCGALGAACVGTVGGVSESFWRLRRFERLGWGSLLSLFGLCWGLQRSGFGVWASLRHFGCSSVRESFCVLPSFCRSFLGSPPISPKNGNIHRGQDVVHRGLVHHRSPQLLTLFFAPPGLRQPIEWATGKLVADLLTSVTLMRPVDE